MSEDVGGAKRLKLAELQARLDKLRGRQGQFDIENEGNEPPARQVRDAVADEFERTGRLAAGEPDETAESVAQELGVGLEWFKAKDPAGIRAEWAEFQQMMAK